MNKIIRNLFYLLFPLLIGSIVGIIISGYIDYNTLNTPPLSPPGITFPIVWTILYILMGIAYFIYRKNYNDKKTITVYYLQLFVNALWSIIFFVLKWRFIAILWTLLLVILVVYLFILYLGQEKISAYLNIPYIAWLLFATYLTIGVYILN